MRLSRIHAGGNREWTRMHANRTCCEGVLPKRLRGRARLSERAAWG